ncbi:hypothetical protein HGB13_03565, partial [bacterium]|nr:hypothetical protein [bacterium]
IIEEGLNGLKTNIDSPDKKGKNGLTFLYPCLESQKPIDIIILQLGKNNLKSKYNASSKSVAKGIEECIKVIQKEGKTRYGKIPKIILIPVLPIIEKINMHAGRMENAFVGANKKSISLLPLYKEIAHNYKIEFIDITKFVKVSGIDGVHMTANSHRVIGTKIAELIIN